MRTLIILVSSVFVFACGGKPSAEKCTQLADHVVSLAGKKPSPPADADPAKLEAIKEREAKQKKSIEDGCAAMPESVVDCMLAAKDQAGYTACRPQ